MRRPIPYMKLFHTTITDLVCHPSGFFLTFTHSDGVNGLAVFCILACEHGPRSVLHTRIAVAEPLFAPPLVRVTSKLFAVYTLLWRPCPLR